MTPPLLPAILVVTGASGAGKTTLVKRLAALALHRGRAGDASPG